MDPPLVNEASFTASANPSSYSLAGLLSFPSSTAGGMDAESTLTDLTAAGRKRALGNSTRDLSATEHLSESIGKRMKVSGSSDENGGSKTEAEANSGISMKLIEEKNKLEPPKDYIHVRARRGQATDSHSLAERARREKISERMKILQDLVPGCNKVIGKALVLDEIINYIQSLQRQVEFLSMKLEAVNSRMNPIIEGFPSKDLAAPTFDSHGVTFGSQTGGEYGRGSQAEWLHMQLGSGFERAT